MRMGKLWLAMATCALTVPARTRADAPTRDGPTVADVLAWGGLPDLMLGLAADTADRAVTLTGADVTEIKPEQDDSTVENGISIYFADKPYWCGPLPSVGVFCWEDRRECAKRTKTCRATKNVACMGATAHTTGDEGTFCRTTYGECERTRRQLELTDEYALGECHVIRQRAKK